jgi:hypothetical protein
MLQSNIFVCNKVTQKTRGTCSQFCALDFDYATKIIVWAFDEFVCLIVKNILHANGFLANQQQTTPSNQD